MKKLFIFVIVSLLGMTILFCGCAQGQNYKDSAMQAYLADSVLYAGEDTVGDYILTCGIRQPLQLEEAWKNDSIVMLLLNYYNVYEIQNSFSVDLDALSRYEVDDYSDFVKLVRDIDYSALHDESLRKNLKGIFDLNADYYATDTAQRDAFGKQNEDKLNVYQEKVGGYCKRVSNLTIVVDEKEVDDILDALSPVNWMPNVYTDFAAEDAKPDSTKVSKLFEDMLAEKNIDKRAAMLFALASTWQMNEEIIPYMEQLMESGEYSPMLPLLWRAYRVTYNLAYSCPSTFCYSPNIRYNHYRRLVAHTLLHHIHDNPNDKTAIVNFYFHAERESILRFGKFIFGNESGTEQLNIFWGKQVL